MTTTPPAGSTPRSPPSESAAGGASDILRDELGILPTSDVAYNPFCLMAVATRLFYEDYGAYIDEMKDVARLFDDIQCGLQLRISAGTAGNRTGPDTPDTVVDRALLSAFGDGASSFSEGRRAADEGHERSTRNLSATLQSLGGIVLRPQGGGDRGFVVPPVVLHYGKAMAEIAEMYCEDVAGDFEGSGGSDEWVCRPAEWCVKGSVATQLQSALTRVCTDSAAVEDGSAMPMLAIDANTSSEETLGLIAAYCAAVSSSHVKLDRSKKLRLSELPVFPLPSPPKPVVSDHGAGRPPRLPVTLNFQQPFPHLSASSLLPPATNSSIGRLFRVVRQGGDKFRVASQRIGLTVHRWKDLPRFCVKQANPTPQQVQAFSSCQLFCNRIVDELLDSTKRFCPPLTPLEAVFAIKYLLPPLAGEKTWEWKPPARAWSFESAVESNAEAIRSFYKATLSLPTLEDGEVDCAAAFPNISFDYSNPCGNPDERVCGGYQVEPRLGFIDYRSFTGNNTGFVAPPTFVSPHLPCTLDQFLGNGAQKARRIVTAMSEDVWKADGRPLDLGLASVTHDIANTSRVVANDTLGMYVAWGLTRNDLDAMQHLRNKIGLYSASPPVANPPLPRVGDETAEGLEAPLKYGCGDETALKDATPRHTMQEEQSMILASLARTTDVMKVANFLGLTSLVNLCGLVIAIQLRGKSLAEVKAMFEKLSPTISAPQPYPDGLVNNC